MNFYKRFPGDIQRKTGHLTPAEMGIYDRLLDWYYSNERPLPAEPHRCWGIAGAVMRDDQASVAKVLEEFFALTDEGWVQARTEEMIADAQPRIQAARENGKKGGRPAGSTKKKPTGFSAETQSGAQAESQKPHSAKASQSQSITSSPTSKKQYKAPPPPKGGAVGPGFEAFWNAFPASTRKAARLQCWNKWKAKGLDDQAEAIVDHVKAMAASEAWTKDGGQYIPAPLTYLNQARWEAPTEAQTAEAKQEANWRDSPAAVSKRGKALGLGEWSEALWVAGKAPDYPAYLRSVEKALAAQQPLEETA